MLKNNQIHPVNQKALEKFTIKLNSKPYSLNTKRLYTTEFKNTLLILKGNAIDSLTREAIKAFLLYCVNTLKYKERKLNGLISAMKFYFEYVLKQPKIFSGIPRPKLAKRSEIVLNKKEIQKILSVIENEKHLFILYLIYDMGLRVREIVNLKTGDLDRNAKQILISENNNKHNRLVNVPSNLVDLIDSYLQEYKPKEWLFEGRTGGQYSVRSVQAIIKNAINKSKIKKRVGIHGLSTSYADQLLAAGVDLRFLFKL